MISINATLVLQVVHLLILIFILNRLLFRPTLKVIRERTSFIENSKKEIMEIEQKAEQLKKEYFSIQKKAMRQASKEGTRLKEEGLQEVDKIMEDSMKQIDKIRNQAETRANEEVQSAKPQIQGQATTLADEIAERVIGRSMAAPLFAALVSALLVGLLLAPLDAFADEGVSSGRRLWNNLMLWVNFGIMAFIFIRYAKKPLMDFLHGVRRKIEGNLQEVDVQLAAAKSAVSGEDAKLKGIDEEIRQMHERVLEMAKSEKEQIIDSGRVTAEKMIENAKAYAEYRLATARKAIFDEMVDLAVSMAEERLKERISPEDGERLFADFVDHLEKSRPRLAEKTL